MRARGLEGISVETPVEGSRKALERPGLRVGYLTNLYPFPAHTFVRREIQALERAGVDVRRFSIRQAPSELVDRQDISEFRRTDILLDGNWWSLAWAVLAKLVRSPRRLAGAGCLAWFLGGTSERGRLRHLAYLVEACWLVRKLERDGVRHLHAHFATNPATVAWLCHRLGGPRFSFTAHGIDAFLGAEEEVLRAKISAAAFVVGVSEAGVDTLRRLCSGCSGKIHLVRCGLPECWLNAEPTEIPESKRLLFVGRLAEEKSVASILRCTRSLVDEGRGVRLRIAGDGPQKADLEADAARLGIDDSVDFLGWLPGSQVASELRSARALVMASNFEGLPTAIIEAYSLGRPVVATDAGAVSELVRSGETGWLVPIGDDEALLQALREVVSAPTATLSNLAMAGRAQVRRDHDSDQGASHLLRLVLDASRPASG